MASRLGTTGILDTFDPVQNQFGAAAGEIGYPAGFGNRAGERAPTGSFLVNSDSPEPETMAGILIGMNRTFLQEDVGNIFIFFNAEISGSTTIEIWMEDLNGEKLLNSNIHDSGTTTQVVTFMATAYCESGEIKIKVKGSGGTAAKKKLLVLKVN